MPLREKEEKDYWMGEGSKKHQGLEQKMFKQGICSVANTFSIGRDLPHFWADLLQAPKSLPFESKTSEHVRELDGIALAFSLARRPPLRCGAGRPAATR